MAIIHCGFVIHPLNVYIYNLIIRLYKHTSRDVGFNARQTQIEIRILIKKKR